MKLFQSELSTIETALKAMQVISNTIELENLITKIERMKKEEEDYQNRD
jgi:hypothetical protein